MSVPIEPRQAVVPTATRRRSHADERRARARRFAPSKQRPARAVEAARWRVFMALANVEARVAQTPQEWTARVADATDEAALRGDSRALVQRLAQIIAGASEEGTLVVRRLTQVRIAELLGRSTRTVRRWVRWLKEARVLVEVAPGVSAAHAAPDSHGQQHNQTPVYVLACPAEEGRDEASKDAVVDELVHPPERSEGVRGLEENPTRARAREAAALVQMTAARHAGRTLAGADDNQMIHDLPLTAPEPFWDIHRAPRTRVEMLAAAAELRRRSLGLRRASLAALRAATRDFWRAGWTVADVLGALDVKPDGTAWPHSGADGVRAVGPWCRYRLSAWRQSDQQPLRGPSQRRAAQRDAQRCALERARQQRLADRARAMKNPVTAATRQLLADARAAAREAVQRQRRTHHMSA